jgi:dihydrofolate reductase
LAAARGDAMRRGTDIMVIGGAAIYRQAMPLADRLEITRIHLTTEGDTHFPEIDPAVWQETARTEHRLGENDDVSFATLRYERRQP